MPVGKVIALLAEEGDDISNLKAPEEQTPSSKETPTPEPPSASPGQATTPSQPASPTPAHSGHLDSSKPIFPSVHRLLLENGITNADKIKGTGVRGMLTKGDVLAHLGKVKSPYGTYKEVKSPFPEKISGKPQESLVSFGNVWLGNKKLMIFISSLMVSLLGDSLSKVSFRHLNRALHRVSIYNIDYLAQFIDMAISKITRRLRLHYLRLHPSISFCPTSRSATSIQVDQTKRRLF